MRYRPVALIYFLPLAFTDAIPIQAGQGGEKKPGEILFAQSLFWMAASHEERFGADTLLTTLENIRSGNVTEPTPSLVSLVTIPSGSFLMGNSGSPRDVEVGRDTELPRHQVDIGYSFLLGRYEVTNTQYAEMLNWANDRGYLRNSTGGDYVGGNVYLSGFVLIEIVDGSEWYEQGFLNYNGNFYVESRDGIHQGDHPVMRVSWRGAVAFCNWLSEREGRTPAYDPSSNWALTNPAGGGYRLPSEAEWEYACRGSDLNPDRYAPFSFGDDLSIDLEECCQEGSLLNSFMRWCGNSADLECFNPALFCQLESCDPLDAWKWTAPAGSHSPNDYGLFDMHGNVAEWCDDLWHDTYEGAPSNGEAWIDTSGLQVVRGGSWIASPEFCRSASRDSISRGTRSSYIGFRVVRIP